MGSSENNAKMTVEKPKTIEAYESLASRFYAKPQEFYKFCGEFLRSAIANEKEQVAAFQRAVELRDYNLAKNLADGTNVPFLLRTTLPTEQFVEYLSEVYAGLLPNERNSFLMRFMKNAVRHMQDDERKALEFEVESLTIIPEMEADLQMLVPGIEIKYTSRDIELKSGKVSRQNLAKCSSKGLAGIMSLAL